MENLYLYPYLAEYSTIGIFFMYATRGNNPSWRMHYFPLTSFLIHGSRWSCILDNRHSDPACTGPLSLHNLWLLLYFHTKKEEKKTLGVTGRSCKHHHKTLRCITSRTLPGQLSDHRLTKYDSCSAQTYGLKYHPCVGTSYLLERLMCGLESPVFDSGQKSKIFLSKRPHRLWGALPSIQ